MGTGSGHSRPDLGIANGRPVSVPVFHTKGDPLVHRPHRFPLLLALLFLPVAPGCASWRQGPVVDYRPPFGPDAHAIVYVCDGAGNFRATSAALRKGVVAEKLPLYIKT